MKKVFNDESLNATFEALNYDYEDMKDNASSKITLWSN